MAVAHIQAGQIVASFRDVETLAQAREKYPHLKGKTLVVTDHPPGMRYSGGQFSAPPSAPRPVEPEPPVIRALRALARHIGPDAVAVVNADLGEPRP